MPSGWATFFVKSQPLHDFTFSLINAARRERRRIVTSNYVLAELSALLISPLRVPAEVRLTMLDRIRTASWVDILHVDPSADSASRDYLFARRDKDFSLVDCSSFVIMEKPDLTASVTTDGHFEQAGFSELVKAK